MASSIALRRIAASSNAKLFNPSLARSFNSNAHTAHHQSFHLDHPRFRPYGFPSFAADVFHTFYPIRVIGLMDRPAEDPYLAASRGGRAGSKQQGDLYAKEDDDALRLKMDMPGLAKEDVKVSVEQNMLVIKGEASDGSEEEEEEVPRCFSSRIELPENLFELDLIKAEMKNGVLKVTVPKVKAEERYDVKQVTVE